MDIPVVPCHHCGEPVAGGHPVTAGDHRFCCEGCAAAAAWIQDADLGSYYRLRSANANRVQADRLDLESWDRSELLDEHSRAVEGGREIVLLTDGMRCAACAWLIDRALAREAGVLDTTANAVTGRIRIAWDPARTKLSALLQRVAMLGYRPYLATGDAREQARLSERRRWLLRLGVAGLGSLQAMMLAEALYLDVNATMPLPTRDLFRWLTFLVSTPVVFYSGWPFLAGMARELRARHVGMDTLIASSTLLAYFASLAETIRGGTHVWYDAAVMFVFLLLAARMLEQRARNVATAQVDALARAQPVFAIRERADGTRESVPPSALRVTDVVCVSAGEGVPADGVLLDHAADFEEALLTGESRPVRRHAGETVYAGTTCRERPARLRVTATGTATRLSQLAELVDRAQGHRPPMAQLADRVGRHFVVSLLVLAVCVYIGWRMYQPERAFEVTLALLVISCPCALSLSVPAVLAAAHGALARSGVLATRPEALDTLARATDVVFDKTGTLSDGRPARVAVEVFGELDADAATRIVAALEKDSGHPIATAFADIDARAWAQAVVARPGQGVEGDVDGRHWRFGRADWAAHRADDGGLWLGDVAHGVARFTLNERPREDAAATIRALRAQGLDVHLASGDSEGAVQRLAHVLGIVSPLARQSPEDKLARVRQLQSEGRIVAMVGDGLNDAPVLAGADVSIAMGEGAPLAQQAADLVATGPSLLRIADAVRIARLSRRLVKQNLAWSAGYNLLAVPLAAAGMVTPWIAALGMAVSSLVVTLNALRLARTSTEMAA
ncbi:heavy metal translocating P-type ATPase [Pseudoxanthomonas sp. SE1]|uniref:heavy metal translocating P-type ATPase n=1 Tax=Pseudoxanthomonas sp. SE1 TaxID=1664560 RepID=UPI00240E62D2|nr:heavy metal translocating P-type ATPase [Pseudoxanthomonas sp. SE1]WFC41631.1 heavy metal translocating P-type ATPase [Pseudoxanthomonas sp. SE1]